VNQVFFPRIANTISKNMVAALLNNLPTGVPTMPPTEAASLPLYSLVAIAHVVAGSDQLAIVALAYSQSTDAQAAAAILPGRLAAYQSIAAKKPLTDVLKEKNITAEPPKIYASATTGQSVVLLAFRGPLESQTPSTSGDYAPSGDIFDLFFTAAISNDLQWLSAGNQ